MRERERDRDRDRDKDRDSERGRERAVCYVALKSTTCALSALHRLRDRPLPTFGPFSTSEEHHRMAAINFDSASFIVLY